MTDEITRKRKRIAKGLEIALFVVGLTVFAMLLLGICNLYGATGFP